MIRRISKDRIALKTILIISLATMFITLSNDLKAQNTYNGEEVFIAVEVMPSFPGGDKALYESVYKNLKYPSSAQDKGIQGKVFVKFIVTKDGSVANAIVARPVDPALDQAALDAIKKLPKFTPGKKEGKAVNVWYSMPIVFKLIE